MLPDKSESRFKKSYISDGLLEVLIVDGAPSSSRIVRLRETPASGLNQMTVKSRSDLNWNKVWFPRYPGSFMKVFSCVWLKNNDSKRNPRLADSGAALRVTCTVAATWRNLILNFY